MLSITVKMIIGMRGLMLLKNILNGTFERMTETTVSKSINPGQRDILKSKLGNAIALIPGKSEAWLMLAFEDNMSMYFKGDNSADYAYVEVSLFGGASDAAGSER